MVVSAQLDNRSADQIANLAGVHILWSNDLHIALHIAAGARLRCSIFAAVAASDEGEMRIVVTRGASSDTIEIRRRDGSVVNISLPHKGPVPHDVVHFFVELDLGFENGFWGRVAGGQHPEEIGAIAKAAGHASASRRRTPDPFFVPAIQAERIVECFEADLWGGGSDPETFNEMVAAGCEQSLVPTIAVKDEAIARVRSELTQFRDGWAALPLGGSCALEWPDERMTSSAS